jgi:hypothetical protein
VRSAWDLSCLVDHESLAWRGIEGEECMGSLWDLISINSGAH